MKKIITLLALAGLTGCGANQVITNQGGQPDYITVSAFTMEGCWEELDLKLKELGLVVVKKEWRWNANAAMAWPLVHGATCGGTVKKIEPAIK